ncbi:MAG: DNA polymerase III subunit alpha [Myxococcota bacterium]
MAAHDFTHLHLHTQYSFLDGAIRVPQLIKRVHELGMKQVAVTDHGNLFGALDFYRQAVAGGIKPILGIEAYITAQARYTDKVRENNHLILLAENNTGYANLRRLSSEAFLNGKYYFPRIDKQLLYEHREGLIATTACLGSEVSKKCAVGDLDGAREAVRDFKAIFGADHFFLEVQPNGIAIQEKVNADLAQLAQDEGLRLVATSDCHYVMPEDHEAQNILMAIRQQKAWDDPSLHKHEANAFYIRSGQEMWDALKTDYAAAFTTACDIGQRCRVELQLGDMRLPNFACPKPYKDEADYLNHLVQQGLQQRLQQAAGGVDRDHYRQRLQTELDIIIKMGFAGYFLVVQDFINWAKNRQIRVGPGRGSGAGSLVAYSLRITDVDPIAHGLLFERFLNPERVSLPDFDVDFMQQGRGDVIDYVAQRYGRQQVAQIATYAALNPKSAIKDVARTLGIPFGEVNQLTKPMPLLIAGKKPTFDEALQAAPQLLEKAKEDATYKKLLRVARTLEGLYRQAGMHAGGVVIGNKPLLEEVPVFVGPGGELITQFDKDMVELAGLVKFDFLGLKTLDLINRTEQLVNQRIARENQLPQQQFAQAAQQHPHYQPQHSKQQIPPLVVDDLQPTHPDVFALIASGETSGIFQVESPGFTQMCRRLKPDCFEDIIAAGALYRPGPMQSGMVDDFIDRKHGRKSIVYPHPKLEPVLKNSYGTFVYQEHVLLSAQVLAGFTLGEADILRRAMGKKKFDEMKQQRNKFVTGAQKQGVDAAKAGEIFDAIEKFAGYGFNKSHAAGYALITYQTAYLKCFYPVEFMAALLSISSGSPDSVVKYVQQARSMGIAVLPPDIYVSDRQFAVDYNMEQEAVVMQQQRLRKKAARSKLKRDRSYGCIRFGLEAVKGLGEAATSAILAARGSSPPTSLMQFCQQITAGRLTKKSLEVLIKAGALDCLQQPRKQLYESIDTAMRNVSKLQRDRARGQSNMFNLFAARASKPAVQGQQHANKQTDALHDEWPQHEKLRYEHDTLGFYLSGHPLDNCEQDMQTLAAVPIQQLFGMPTGEAVRLVGIVTQLRERTLKNGLGTWATVVLEDQTGQVTVMSFSNTYAKAQMLLYSDEPLVLQGRIMSRDDDNQDSDTPPRVRLESVSLLQEAQCSYTRYVHVRVDTQQQITNKVLQQVHTTCQRHKGDKLLLLSLQLSDKLQVDIRCDQQLYVQPCTQLLHDLRSIAGVVHAERVC